MATGFVELSAKGTVSGIAMVGNLPFPAEPHTQGVPQPPPSIIFFNLGTAWASLTGLLLADTTTILLFGLPPAGGVSAVTLNAAADLTNTSAIGLTICYLAQD
jgi:hypothetical protein